MTMRFLGLSLDKNRRLLRLSLMALALLIPATGVALLQVRNSKTAAIPTDPAADLQQKIDTGKVKLEFEPNQGYLRSLLKNLKIPISSQALVFSKSSFDLGLISPSNPRALYFNDDSYVGWVPPSPIIEIASVDPKAGAVFYTLSQEKTSRPKFERKTTTPSKLQLKFRGFSCYPCSPIPRATQ